jgi:hypothetical protein
MKKLTMCSVFGHTALKRKYISPEDAQYQSGKCKLCKGTKYAMDITNGVCPKHKIPLTVIKDICITYCEDCGYGK